MSHKHQWRAKYKNLPMNCLTQGIIRAQELIDESKSAQLIIQHVELGKLKQSVHAKEEGKEERCILLKGKGLG